MKKFFVSICFVLFAATWSLAQNDFQWKTATSNGYTYKYVTNDPAHARFYTLKNGLTVILSPSNKEPRIQAYIATKAGSKTDPSNHTGLAHYLEHMLFKGTDKFGSLDWAKEKPYIDEIEKLYEKYNSTKDEALRTNIYHQIDSVSNIAAKYAIANEYDKMMESMGAEGTNAFTSFEQTVYTEDIPSNVIDKYLAVQSERFRYPVFRLFHTELEAVYEEKNRSLDNDGSKVYETMFRLLFPNNNYGKQTTIGTIEDLKNPSLYEIRKYFNTYYVPNNMGIIMAGDFNPDEVIAKIDKAFSYMKPKPIPPYNPGKESPILKPLKADVYGPQPARLMMGYRFPGAKSDDARMLNLIGEILTNGSAGLIDLDLVKKQKLLGAYAFPYILNDYSVLVLGGNPIAGQSLEDVQKLLLQEIGKLKSGDFDENILTAIINNEKKSVLESTESYSDRADELMSNFTDETDWAKQVSYVKWLGTITKQDIINFANKYFADNYAVIYKHQGDDKNVEKVEKPKITPVSVNRDAQSDFVKMVAAIPENPIQPVWLNYSKDIQKATSGKYPVLAVKNKDNELFDLTYYLKTGTWSNKYLSTAVGYLEFLGTKDKSAEEFSKEFYSLASSFNLWATSEETYLSLSGLQEKFEKTVQLFDDLMKHCVADQDALNAYIKRLQQARDNAKKNKGRIMVGLRNYALYGPKNPFNSGLTKDELANLKAEDLVKILHDLANSMQTIIYYGPASANEIATKMSILHAAPKKFTKFPKQVEFKQLTQAENSALVAHYDMVQAEIFWVHNSDVYNENQVPQIDLFNQYYGGGMGSVVFQTIRESKALAYSTYAYYVTPSKRDRRNSFMAYVGTQSDKFAEAVDGMNELLNKLPETEKSLVVAKAGLQKKLASDRVTGESIIYNYLAAQKMGRDYDIREKVYNALPTLTMKDLENFFNQEIKDQKYTYCIVAGDGKLDQKKLNSLGTVKVLSLEEIFGY